MRMVAAGTDGAMEGGCSAKSAAEATPGARACRAIALHLHGTLTMPKLAAYLVSLAWKPAQASIGRPATDFKPSGPACKRSGHLHNFMKPHLR